MGSKGKYREKARLYRKKATENDSKRKECSIRTLSLCLLFYVCLVRAYHTVTKSLDFLTMPCRKQFDYSTREAISEQGLPA